MRRKDREKSGDFALGVLSDCNYASLATTMADGSPYCVMISPVVLGGCVYFHCAEEGQKLDNIRRDCRVCLTCARRAEPESENYTMRYESAVVFGSCTVVEDGAEKLSALRALCEKYAPGNMEGFEAAAARSFERTCVCRVEIAEITGKSNI